MAGGIGSTDDALVAIATRSYVAFAEQDRAAMERLLADDFHFTSPRDNRLDRAAFFERCWPGGAAFTGFTIVATARTGDRVFVTYEARRTDGATIRNTEALTIRGGRIVEVEVYFGWNVPHEAPPGGSIDDANG